MIEFVSGMATGLLIAGAFIVAAIATIAAKIGRHW